MGLEIAPVAIGQTSGRICSVNTQNSLVLGVHDVLSPYGKIIE